MSGNDTKRDSKTQESPTNVRNGKDLVEKAIEAFQNDRCRTALIQPQKQAFHLDCRERSFYDFRPHLAMLGHGTGDSGRWLYRDLVDGLGRSSYSASSVPPTQSTARCHLGPAVARTLEALLSSETESPLSSDKGKFKHLMVFEGAAGKAIQKYCIVHSAGQTAAVAFYNLANGYSMVFAGIVLRESYDDVRGFREAMTYHHCKTVEDLEAIADSQPPLGDRRPLRYHTEGKETIGIIY